MFVVYLMDCGEWYTFSALDSAEMFADMMVEEDHEVALYEQGEDL